MCEHAPAHMNTLTHINRYKSTTHTHTHTLKPTMMYSCIAIRTSQIKSSIAPVRMGMKPSEFSFATGGVESAIVTLDNSLTPSQFS